MISIPPNIEIADEEFEFSYARSGGPGGQNVNKVNSKAILRWSPALSTGLPEDVRARFLIKYASRLTLEGELLITSQKYRDQPGNASDCLIKLQLMLETVAKAPTVRKKTRPSKAAKERRVESKKRTSEKKSQRRSPGYD